MPVQSVREELLRAYTALKSTVRPVRMVTEKEAVKLLRAAKKARKEDFRKALPKAKAALLADTPYAPIVPYYLIADGGWLDAEYEYELLAPERAAAETEAFRVAMLAEELMTDKPDGVAIAACADGDKVLLLTDGAVIRFSHEEPAAVNRWPSLAQFIAETVNDSE